MLKRAVLSLFRKLFSKIRIIILENLFVVVSFDFVTGATNNSMNGKHWDTVITQMAIV